MLLKKAKARLLVANETAEEDLLAQINDLYVEEIRSDEKVLKEALSELHNSGEIDLVKLVKKVDKSSHKHSYFTIQHAFENALPLLNARVEDVLHSLVHLSEQSDTGVGYRAFERFCRIKAHRPKDSIRFILEQRELSTYALFLASAILAYDSERVTEAIETTQDLLKNRNEIVRSQAYFTLGRLDVGEAKANVIWELLSSSADSEHESNCCASILEATLYFGKKFPSYWQLIEELLSTFIEGAPPEVLYAISSITAYQIVDIPENIQYLLVRQLANISSEHKNIIGNIDYLLVRLVERGSSSVAVELLESILAVGVKISSLNYLSNELLSKHRELLNHIITKWFLSGESLPCHNLLELLYDVTGKDIELKAKMVLLDDEDKKAFASRKAAGWLFTRPISAASFILSIYESASEITRENIEQLLYDPLLLSYPGELKQFLQSCVDRNIQKQLCNRLLGKLHTYHTELEKAFGLKELMAPSGNLRTYWESVNRDMQEAQEEASKTSILGLIATTQRVLYGNSSVYYVHQEDGNKVRQEMKMQSFSHSTEMPRLCVLDPESLDYTLRVYRYESMKNEVNS